MGKYQQILTRSFLTTPSGFTYQSLLCSRLYSAHMALYIFKATSLSLSVLNSSKHASAADGVPWSLNVVCTTYIWDLVQCGKSSLPLPWCWETSLKLPWSELRCCWCCFHWAIDMYGPCLRLLTHFCARLFIIGCRFLWLFSGGYKAFAFSHQLVTFCFPADIRLEVLLFLAHNIFDAVQSFSSLLPAGV